MAAISTEVLHAIAEGLAGVPVNPTDLAACAAQLGSQLDGLARLDDLDLQNVEPATLIPPPMEAPHAA